MAAQDAAAGTAWSTSRAPGSVPPVGWRHSSLRTARRESSERGRAFFPLAPAHQRPSLGQKQPRGTETLPSGPARC